MIFFNTTKLLGNVPLAEYKIAALLVKGVAIWIKEQWLQHISQGITDIHERHVNNWNS